MQTNIKDNIRNLDVIGLIPAAGKANRISPLPCSKELYPVGFRYAEEDNSYRPKVVSHYLLEKMRLAGIDRTFIVIRDGKWDIPAYLGDGVMCNMNIAYLMMRLPFGAPYTIDQAFPFIKDSVVAFGFPDILMEPDDLFVHLLKRRSETDADIVLGVFPVDEPHKWDMVDIRDDMQIIEVITKPHKSDFSSTWAAAVWSPRFTHFMHEYLNNIQKDNKDNVSVHKEMSVGAVIQSAISNSFHVEGVLFPDKACLDIGTFEDLIKAVRMLSHERIC